jgi:hypothetical protein
VRILALVIMTLGLAGCAASQTPSAPGELQPADFARGVTIASPPGQPFFRVSVPDRVFNETAWPDLRDVRVFNADGEPVPFARVVPSRPAATTERVALRSFRLASTATAGSVPRIELDAQSRGVELRVMPGAGGQAGVEYLVAVDGALTAPVEGLHLDWSDRTSNWQQRVTVSASTSLQGWDVVAFQRLVMDLKTDDGQRLKHGEIPFGQPASQSYRYWRLKFEPGEAPSLTSVEAEITAARPPAPGVQIPASLQPQTDGTAVYVLPSVQPVLNLRITPQAVNSVLPLLVEGRAEATGAWQPLGRTVAHRLSTRDGEQISAALPLGGTHLQAVRLRAMGTTWGTTPPEVSAEREPLTLVANARGTGPFLLAWGSRVARDTSLPFSTLVPNGATVSADVLPEGTFLAQQELGGASRLTAQTPSERAARWQTLLVWIALIGGAGLLATLAFRVWRDARL